MVYNMEQKMAAPPPPGMPVQVGHNEFKYALSKSMVNSKSPICNKIFPLSQCLKCRANLNTIKLNKWINQSISGSVNLKYL